MKHTYKGTRKFSKVVISVIAILALMLSDVRIVTPLINLVTTLNTETSLAEASTLKKGYLEKTTVNNTGGYCTGNRWSASNAEECLQAGGQWVPSSSATITDTIKFTYDSTSGVISFSKPNVLGIVVNPDNRDTSKYDSCRTGEGWNSKHFYAYQNNVEGVFTKTIAQMNSHSSSLVFDESGSRYQGAEYCQEHIQDNYGYSLFNVKSSWQPLVGNPYSNSSGSNGTYYDVIIPKFHLNKNVLDGKNDFEWVTIYLDNGIKQQKRYTSDSYQLFWEGNVSSGGGNAIKGSLERKVDTSSGAYCVGNRWGVSDAQECLQSGGQWVPATSGARVDLIRFVYYPNEGYIRTENPNVLGIVVTNKNLDRTKYDSCRTGEGYSSKQMYAYQNNLEGVFAKPVAQMNTHSPSLVFDESGSRYQGAEYCGDYVNANGYNVLSLKPNWRPWAGNAYSNSSGSNGSYYDVEIPKFHLNNTVISGKLDFDWVNVMFDYGIETMERYTMNTYQLFWGFGGSSDGGSSGPPPKIVCPAGTIPKPSADDPKWCDNYVKVDNVVKNDNIGKIDLSTIIGNYGSTGDGAVNLGDSNSGHHSNGWHLDGQGKGYNGSHVQVTNVPDNGYVNALGDSWSPEIMITQGKTKLEIPIKDGATAVERQVWDKSLSEYKASKSNTELIVYTVNNLDKLKEIQESEKGLVDLFTKQGSEYKHASDIKSATINNAGINDYDKVKINQGGYFLIAAKYVDMPSAVKEQATPNQATLDKHTYYSFIPINVNFMADLNYLPVYNNLLAQVNEKLLVIGNKKVNHKIPNLQYESYKSMKVPSAYNTGTSKTLIGSTTSGLQLTDAKMTPVTITGETTLATSAKVTDIVEHSNGFYIATDKGILYLNCEDNSLTKTIITEPVNDLELHYDTLYSLTDTRLSVLFADGMNIIKSSKEHDLTTMFNDPTTKAGRVELLNGLLTVSSKDDSSLSEVIALTK